MFFPWQCKISDLRCLSSRGLMTFSVTHRQRPSVTKSTGHFSRDGGESWALWHSLKPGRVRQTPRAVIGDPCQLQSHYIHPEDMLLHWCHRGEGGDVLVSSLWGLCGQGMCGHKSLKPARSCCRGMGSCWNCSRGSRDGANANSLSSNRRPLRTTSITLILKYWSNAEARLCWQLQICVQ